MEGDQQNFIFTILFGIRTYRLFEENTLKRNILKAGIDFA